MKGKNNESNIRMGNYMMQFTKRLCFNCAIYKIKMSTPGSFVSQAFVDLTIGVQTSAGKNDSYYME